MSLFDTSERITLPLQDAEIDYYPQFFEIESAHLLFEELYQNTPWIEEDIRVYGKVYKQPRLTAFYANNKKTYSYSNISMTPHPCPFASLRFTFNSFISIKRLKLTMKYSVSFDGHDIDDFRQKVSFFLPKYIYQNSVAYRNSKIYRSVALYQRGW